MKKIFQLSQNIKKKKNIDEFLTGISVRPHYMTFKMGSHTVRCYVLGTENKYIYLSEFIPVNAKRFIDKYKKISCKILEVKKMKLFTYSFDTVFIKESIYKEMRSYQYKIPSTIKIKEDSYIIFPDAGDAVTISFEISGIPYRKHVTKLDGNEIEFNASFDHLKEYFGEIISNIVLNLPFDKVRFSGKLIQIDKKKFVIRDYLYKSSTIDSFSRYSTEDFVVKSNITYKPQKPALLDHEEVNRKDNEPVIIIVNNKKGVSEILQNYIGERTTSEIIISEKASDIGKFIKNGVNYVVILDCSVPDFSDVNDFQELFKNPI